MRKFAAIVFVVTLILNGVTSAAAAQSQFKPTTKTVEAAVERYGNEDIRGWLTVPGTDINRAVAFSPVSNEYYEHRTIEGIQTTASARQPTAEYFSCRTEFGNSFESGSRNIVIFGHNWTNVRPPYRVGVNETDFGFAELPSYTSLDFLNANPYIYFATLEKLYIWEVFTVSFPAVIINYNDPNMTKETQSEILSLIRDMSLYNYDVPVSSDDKIITLTTNIGLWQPTDKLIDCRYMIMAKQVTQSDLPLKQTASLTKNENAVDRSKVTKYVPTPDEKKLWDNPWDIAR